MALTATLETTNNIGKIKLAGELDASSASIFKAEIEKAAAENVKRLVLLMEDLDYMASAGLRVLIFANKRWVLKLTFMLLALKRWCWILFKRLDMIRA